MTERYFTSKQYEIAPVLQEMLKSDLLKDILSANFHNITCSAETRVPNNMPDGFLDLLNGLAIEVDALVVANEIQLDKITSDFKEANADIYNTRILNELDRAESPLRMLGDRLKELAIKEEQKKFPGPGMVERMFKHELLQICSIMAQVRAMQKSGLNPDLLRATSEEVLREQDDFARRLQAKGADLVDMVFAPENSDNFDVVIGDAVEKVKSSDKSKGKDPDKPEPNNGLRLN